MYPSVRALLVTLALAVLTSCTRPAEPPPAGPVDPASLDKKVLGKKADQGVEWQGKKWPKFQVLNRMRLQAQNGLWQNLDSLSSVAVTFDDSQILAAGHWYRALLAGRANNGELAMAHLKLATQNGFENAPMMVEDESLLCVQTRDDFKSMVADLSRKLDQRMREKSRRYTDAAFGSKGVEARPWLPDLKRADGQPFFAAGRPMLVAVSRIWHDGLPKLLQVIDGLQAKRSGLIPVGLLFTQNSPDDSAEREQTEQYVGKLVQDVLVTPEVPWAIVGRSPYNSLMHDLLRRDAAFRAILEPEAGGSPSAKGAADDKAKEREGAKAASTAEERLEPFFNHFPVLVFFDGSAAPIYALEDVPADWQLEYAVARFETAVGKIEPPRKAPEEAPPKDTATVPVETGPAEESKPAEATPPPPPAPGDSPKATEVSPDKPPGE